MAGLKSICLSFRKGVMGKRESDMMCAVVCYPLQSFLDLLGWRTELEEVDLGRCNHVFLRLPDGRVLDPTADQFDGPKVYIGEPQWYHKNGDSK